MHGVERKAGQLVHQPPLAKVPGPAGDGVRTDAREAAVLRRVLRAIDGRSMFVVPGAHRPRHGRRPAPLRPRRRERNPTRYDVMQPGVVTTAEVQREIVRDLRRARPEVLVRWLDPRTRPEDNASGRRRGAHLLDDELRRTYGPPRRIGVYELRERRRGRVDRAPVATLLRMIGFGIVFVIGIGIALVVLEANEDSDVVDGWLDACRFLVAPFDDIFDLERGKENEQIAINWGIAAVVYLVDRAGASPGSLGRAGKVRT